MSLSQCQCQTLRTLRLALPVVGVCFIFAVVACAADFSAEPPPGAPRQTTITFDNWFLDDVPASIAAGTDKVNAPPPARAMSIPNQPPLPSPVSSLVDIDRPTPVHPFLAVAPPVQAIQPGLLLLDRRLGQPDRLTREQAEAAFQVAGSRLVQAVSTADADAWAVRAYAYWRRAHPDTPFGDYEAWLDTALGVVTK